MKGIVFLLGVAGAAAALGCRASPGGKTSSAESAAVQSGAAQSGIVTPTISHTLRGWGMSLAWEANDIYGSTLVNPPKLTPGNQSLFMDLLYGDPSVRQTLGLNVARYNIGGGDAPGHHHMRPDAQMDGFQDGAGQPFDFTRDASQRRMLHEAQCRGASIFEAFSNSPPYWMTNSGCASGSTTGRADNLDPSHYADFVNYLVTVVDHFATDEGILFESLEPFNEPDGTWWKALGSQEGNFAASATQETLIPMVAQALEAALLPTFVSASDMNNLDDETKVLDVFDSATLQSLGRINTHAYFGTGRTALQAKAAALGLPLWMSEVGCCLGGTQGPVPNDGTPMWGALWLADNVRLDLRDMGAEVWVLWQPDWNVITFSDGAPVLNKQYYALAQYTNFIRPGFQIISSGIDNTLAAYSTDTQRLVLVSTNWDTATTNDFDLTGFSNLPPSATLYRTTVDPNVNLDGEPSVTIDDQGHLVDTLPPRSISTYVIDGVITF
jgi:O-glycosyl hydrolase